MLFDIFISHAWEDKDEFVRELAEKLRISRVEVWYDEFSLKPGDSLRRSIDLGLSKSRYGIVVLSKDFINKNWTNWELDGIIQRQNNSESGILIPIWHGVSKDDVIAFSPSLADKVALRSSKGIDYIVEEILKILNPQGSTLIIARNILLEYNFETPVITDDWWLDIVEYSAGNDMEGGWQESMGWGRWGFPLPERDNLPNARGKRLAWTAMQKTWQENAERLNISQITEPDIVLEFIKSQAGLEEMCLMYPHFLATYSPQLTIPGFGGNFEKSFDKYYEYSLGKNIEDSKSNSKGGAGLTINGECPKCNILIALRDKDIGYYQPSYIACSFVQGELMGPPVKCYDTIDYLCWLLSAKSNWLPKQIHSHLLEGIKEWATWYWDKYSTNSYSGFISDLSFNGAIISTIYKLKKNEKFEWNQRNIKDLSERLTHSKKILDLPEDIDQLVARFMNGGFVEELIKKHKSPVTK